MAPRQLMVRWRRDKMRRRLAAPKAFASKAYSGVRSNSKSGADRVTGKENAIFHNSFRANGTERAMRRLQEYIRKHNPHHRILYMLFEPAIAQAEEALTDDPRMAVELLLDRYKAQDPTLRVFQYDVIVLERSKVHCLWMFFRGRSAYLVYWKKNEVRMSIEYNSPYNLKMMPLRTVEWAGEPYEISREQVSSLFD